MENSLMPASNRSGVTSSSVPVSLKERLFNCLEELKAMKFSDNFVIRVSNYKAALALHLIFQLGKKHVNFTGREKRQLGNLLIDTIGLIKVSIECTMLSSTRLNAFLSKRSALQFLVENFGQFPARNSTLKHELEKVNIKQSIKFLDQTIENLRDFFDSSDDSDDSYDSDDSADASDVPDTHTWW